MKVNSSPYVHNNASTQAIMKTVIMAMFPAYAVMVWYFGFGVVVQTFLALGTGFILEVLVAKVRNQPLLSFTQDYSGTVASMILALSIPPYSPWWLIVLGVLISIVVAKHLYGGLGQNIFNPAMVGYAVLLVSFPSLMSSWALPQAVVGQPVFLGEALSLIFKGNFIEYMSKISGQIDGLTQATPLDVWHSAVQGGANNLSFMQSSPLFKKLLPWGYQAQGWLQINLAFLLGGLWLIYKKVITWHIPVSLIASFSLACGVTEIFSPTAPDISWQLASGAIMFGAFFIATEPVTAPLTNRGRIYFAVFVGSMIYVIRYYGTYHDGVAFGVLLGNMLVPVIDYFTKPKVFGRRG